MKRLLITGFDPFNGNTLNPAWMAAEALPEQIGDYIIKKLQVPTIYGDAAAKAIQAAEEFDPYVIICLGLAAGRTAITPERVAINIRDASIADNAGVICTDVPIVPNGPAAYFATLPVKEMITAINETGVAASISNTAGTFVCNDIMYSLLHHFKDSGKQIGFIHLPKIPEMGEPSMKLSDMVKGLCAAIEAL